MFNIKLNFELLTQSTNFYFFYFQVTNSKLKNKKIQFELLTRSLKLLLFQIFVFKNRKQKLVIVQGSFDKNIVQI